MRERPGGLEVIHADLWNADKGNKRKSHKDKNNVYEHLSFITNVYEHFPTKY